ncbi:MAG: hypothetical protein VB118_12085, partial [Oscillospiraceae bacterium]|nr:hypothetical protein [Oscillospiraceae bacterium]
EGNMSWGVSLLKSEDIKYPQIKDIFISVKYDPRSIEETNNLSDPLKQQSYLITDDPELLSLKENYKYPYAYLKTKINDTDVYMFHISPSAFKNYEVLSPDFKVIEFDTFVPTTIAIKMNDLEIDISIKIRTQYDHEQFGMELSTKEDYEAAMKLITDENYISTVIDNIREYLKSRDN